MSEPSTDGLRAAIAEFVASIEKIRNSTCVAALLTTHDLSACNLRGLWSGYALSLATLHQCTGGEFGTLYEDQPSPLGAPDGEVQ